MSLCAASSAALADDSASLAERLHHAAESSSIDDPALKPWHLKLDVQLYDYKGQPSERGTIEEWWTPEKDKRVYALPGYAATEVRNGKTIYRTKGVAEAPYLIDEARNLAVHPIVPAEVIDQSLLELTAESLGKVKLDCIMLDKSKGSLVLAGRVQTYCLDPNDSQLRVSWLDPETATLNSFGNFQKRRVAIESSVAMYGIKAVSEKVTTLATFSPDDSIYASGGDLEDRTADPVWVSAAEMDRMSIRKVSPTYPLEAKRAHIGGSVRMIALIGKDGHVQSLEITGQPNPILAGAAKTAAKQWEYKPYMVDGSPVEVRTTITNHFYFGGG